MSRRKSRAPRAQKRIDEIESAYLATAEEVLTAWDKGALVWSVAMGGMGPAYEQQIQIMAMEMMRAFSTMDVPTEKAMSAYTQAQTEALKGKIDDLAQGVVDQHFRGCSGAQRSAAENLAWRFVAFGPERAIESMGDNSRRILVSRNFPQAPAPPVTGKTNDEA